MRAYIGAGVGGIVYSAGDSGGLWTHLFNTVLGRYIGNTLVLMVGGLVATVFGVGTAWVVSRYDFVGRLANGCCCCPLRSRPISSL